MSFRMSSIQFMANYTASLNKTYREQAKMLEQGDGSKIHRGSDDPIGYSRFLRYSVSSSENDQYQKNVDTAISWMSTSDSAIANIADRMKTFEEKTNAAANSYNTNSDFEAIAKEMMAQIEQVVSVANTQQGDRYVFAGQKDTTQPFLLSNDTYDRGLAKTLDDKQAAFFKGVTGDGNVSLYQMLTVNYNGNTFYLDNESGYLYTKDFVDEGYKELVTQGYSKITDVDTVNTTTTVAATYAVGTVNPSTATSNFKVSDAFNNQGVLLDGVTGVNVTWLSVDADHNVTEGSSVDFNFTTVKQKIVTYSGDDNYISMVKLNGANDRTSDIVNLTGPDMFGSDIFDNDASGNTYSGAAAINNMLTVYAKTNAGDEHWLTSDGITLSDSAHATVVVSETTLGSRLQLYNSVADMLDNQSVTITNDITNVSGTDIAQLATKLMEMTTLYNMALSLGGRVLPQSLADYL